MHSTPLNLSPFTLEEFEQAIKHADDRQCLLIAEIHTCLSYNIRQVTGQRNTASSSLYEQQLDGPEQIDEPVSLVDLLALLATRGSNWERAPLRNTPTREGWQDAIIGLLKDVRHPCFWVDRGSFG